MNTSNGDNKLVCGSRRTFLFNNIIHFNLGVHGGLIVYDDRFTCDLLADILFIQQNKTLLRRHLSIQFSQLLGKDLNQKKRDAQCLSKYKPLTISSKIKVRQIF